ncbi:MAG: hypothetical protein WDM70_10800 [Nitrosomonadales bacterium]
MLQITTNYAPNSPSIAVRFSPTDYSANLRNMARRCLKPMMYAYGTPVMASPS